MESLCRKYLLRIAKAFAKAEGLELTTVSRRFHGGVLFLSQFEKGTVTITLRKFDEMIASFASQWPSGIKWPDGTIELNRKGVKK